VVVGSGAGAWAREFAPGAALAWTPAFAGVTVAGGVPTRSLWFRKVPFLVSI